MEKRPAARRLMTHPGVGPLTALAFELVIGTPERFQCGKQIASYVGLVPSEESSGDRRRLGHISKQGNSLLRFLLVEAAQVTVRSHPQWRSKFFHLALRRGRKIAKVAMARKLAVHLYWMWRQGLGLRSVRKARFARGSARKSPWCAVTHRRNDWASRSPQRGEFEVVIMIAVVIEEMAIGASRIQPWLSSGRECLGRRRSGERRCRKSAVTFVRILLRRVRNFREAKSCHRQFPRNRPSAYHPGTQ